MQRIPYEDETLLRQWGKTVGACVHHREPEDLDALPEQQQAFVIQIGRINREFLTVREGDPQVVQQLLATIREQPDWLGFLHDRKRWSCQACHGEFAWADQRPKESDTLPGPNNAYEHLHTLAHLCEQC